jgi:hypothetical protein
MAREGFFYLDDPPQQGRRYVPIPAQGAQPPNTYPANTLNTILASWPTGLEYAPYQRPLNIAPLTLTYGQQPPTRSTVNLNNALASWVPPDPPPTQRPLTIVPLTFTYGNPPTPTNPALFNSILSTWIPPDPLPYQRRPVAPIPAQGQPPPPTRQRQPDFSLYVDPAFPETLEPVAAIIPSIVTQTPFVPYPVTLIQSWQVDQLQPQRLPSAPIPAQGQQPPPLRQRQPDLSLYVEQYPAESIEPVAAIIPTAVTQTPFIPYPITSIQSWQSDSLPPQPRPVAPIPPQGAQPPPYSIQNQTLIVRSWVPPDLQPQTLVPFPHLPLVYQGNVPYPFTAIFSWGPEPQPAQRSPTAPIPAQGQQPPPYSFVNAYSIINLWQPPDPPPVQRATTAPIPPPIVNNPPTAQPFPWTIIFSWPNGLDYIAPQRSPSFPFPTPAPKGHGKTAGVPDIGRFGGTTAQNIRRWLRKQAEKQAKRERAALHRQSLADQYAAVSRLPRTHRLRSTVRTRIVSASPVTLHVPPLAHLQSHAAPTVSAQFPVALVSPTTHNVTMKAHSATTATAKSIYINMKSIRQQDEILLKALMLQAMME